MTKASISRLLQEHVIAPKVAAAACAGHVGPGASPAVVGAAGDLPGGAPVTPETIFDLASVSKPVVACALARLVERGLVCLSTSLGEVLPALAPTASGPLPLELFLSHRAGLCGHRPLFAPVLRARTPFRRDDALREAANARRAECRGDAPDRGFPPVYSDLGYVLIGACIEAVAQKPLDTVVDEEVARPLGLGLGSARILLKRRPTFAHEVAPTEVQRARGGCVRGVVHDENAWALSGHGCSGHAGLFGTARDVLNFGAAVLTGLSGSSRWLSHETLSQLVRPRPGGTLRAGFDGKSEGGSSAGALVGPDAFGHLGFTGTSLWCDPAAGIATVLLTNRVNPSREGRSGPAIRAARPVVHDALFLAASPLLPGPPDP